MMTHATHTPSQQALKIARIIMNDDVYIFTQYGKKTLTGLADLIDRETTAPDLLAALKRAFDHLIVSEGYFVMDGKVGRSTDWKEAFEQCKAAIAAAEQKGQP
jgi:hypothetical protein